MNEIEYKSLPLTFKGRASQKEFEFSCLKRESKFAIYKKSDQDICYYETIIIQKHDGRTMPNGIFVDPSEYYPSDTTFGLLGWCFMTFEAAEKKFLELSS